jgi:hypothetical protein
MTLSEETKVPYSPFERKVFAKLTKVPKTTSAITDAIWKEDRNRPTYARQSVLGALNGLLEKSKTNREPFRVKRSERTGPHPIKFWVVEK